MEELIEWRAWEGEGGRGRVMSPAGGGQNIIKRRNERRKRRKDTECTHE